MPNIMKPSNNSRENIHLFLNTVEDDDIRNLLTDYLEEIITVATESTGTTESQDNRDRFYGAIETIIESKLGDRP